MHSNMYERSMPSPSSRIRRFIAWFICLFGGLLGLIGATIMFFVSAAVVPSAVILLVIALLVCFGVTYAGCRIGLRLARRSHTTQQRFSLRISVGLSAVFGALVTFFIFRPLMLSAAAPTADATQYWTLSSGSRIAYTYYPALGSREPTPILFLHGGPGLFVLPTDHSFYRQFTRDGFDVYLYDQAGSGRSAPLASIEEYTVPNLLI